MHLATLGCISLRVYADNFYGDAVNRTVSINGTMTLVIEYVRPEEGVYRICNIIWNMIVMRAVVPLLSFPPIYTLYQALVLADTRVLSEAGKITIT